MAGPCFVFMGAPGLARTLHDHVVRRLLQAGARLVKVFHRPPSKNRQCYHHKHCQNPFPGHVNCLRNQVRTRDPFVAPIRSGTLLQRRTSLARQIRARNRRHPDGPKAERPWRAPKHCPARHATQALPTPLFWPRGRADVAQDRRGSRYTPFAHGRTDIPMSPGTTDCAIGPCNR